MSQLPESDVIPVSRTAMPTALKPRIRVFQVDGVTFVFARRFVANKDKVLPPKTVRHIQIGPTDI